MINEMATSFDFFLNERSVLLYHLEHYDGSGHPEGLRGDQIPLGARIFAVADSFSAMTSKRDYKNSLSIDEAVLELADKAGSQFDPDIVILFFKVLEEYEKDSISSGIMKKAYAKVTEFKQHNCNQEKHK